MGAGAAVGAVTVTLARSDEQIEAAFPVIVQLRPHLAALEFVERVRRQEEQGYRLATVTDGATVSAVAGFRILESLAWGRYLYVDDLVTDGDSRSMGHGGLLIEWLVERATDLGCEELHLDSGVQRFRAHRFYLRQRMDIVAHHFSLRL